MRITAGKFKGRKLEFVSDEETRPTADIVRQAFFTKIQFDIANSVFLDLFAGSGGIGLEALSRGAKEVFFVEKNKRNCDIIKRNLIKLYGENYVEDGKEQGQVISDSSLRGGEAPTWQSISEDSSKLNSAHPGSPRSARDDESKQASVPCNSEKYSTKQSIHLIHSDFKAFLNSSQKKVFDFVYIDPPFQSGFYQTTLKELKDRHLITNESMVICEWNRKDKRPFSVEGYEIVSEKKYGTKMLTYLKLID